MSTASEFEAQAAMWLIRREAPNFSPQELAELEAWLGANPRHRAAYMRLEAAWRRADKLTRLRPLDGPVDEDLLAVSPFPRLEEFPASTETRRMRDRAAVRSDELAELVGTNQATAESRRRRWRGVLTAAAAVAVITVAAAVWLSIERSGWREYTTDFGGIERIVLDDRSVVHLNTNSVVRVHLTRELREIVLVRGEALFKVAHDASRPFDVHAGETTVRAVGTEFSVRLRDAREAKNGRDDVEVLVREGRVAIDPPDKQLERATALPPSPSASTLSAGEAVTISAKRVHVQRVADADVTRKLSWVEGRLWFERETLANVVAEFNRYNRRQMVIADPTIVNLRIGGGFEATDPESFMAALERTLGVRAFPSPEGSEQDVIRLVGTGDKDSTQRQN